MRAATAILQVRRGLCHACKLVETAERAGRLYQCPGCTAAVPVPLAPAPHDSTARERPALRAVRP